MTDSKTGDNVITSNKVLSSDSADDMCFEFIVERIDGCDDEYSNTLQSTVGIQTSPPISSAMINNAKRSYSSSESRFSLCFEGEDI